MFLFIGERREHTHPERVRTGCPMLPNFKALNSVILEDVFIYWRAKRARPSVVG